MTVHPFTRALMAVAVALLICAAPAAAKSLYVIANINANPSPVQAYNIQGNSLTYQATYSVPSYAGGAVGLTIDTDSEFLFVTYEVSSVIQLVNAKTMTGAGSVTAPNASNLAGIVVDQHKQKVYTVDRNTNHLYIYAWNAVTKTLTNTITTAPYYISLPGIYYTGAHSAGLHGIALDEVNDRLYCADVSNTIKVFDTATWALLGTIPVSQKPMSVAVDVAGGKLYSGNAYGPYGSVGLLCQYNLITQQETTLNIRTLAGGVSGDNVVGIAVDPLTGIVYVTTGDQGSGGSDRLLAITPALQVTYASGDIGNPTGLCVPGKEVSYNPLNLTKDDGIGAGTVMPGQTFTYTLCYDNLQNTTAVSNVSIVDTLPAGVTFVSATGGGIYTPATHQITWNPGGLPAGAAQQCVQVTVTVNASAPPGGTLVNSATIDSDQTPPTTVNEVTQIAAILPVLIDVYPNQVPNRIYLSKPYTIYVAVLGSANFNVQTINWTTVRFGPAKAAAVRAPTIRDLNGDGVADAMYGFLTQNCGFAMGQTTAKLIGATSGGMNIEGTDSIVVYP